MKLETFIHKIKSIQTDVEHLKELVSIIAKQMPTKFLNKAKFEMFEDPGLHKSAILIGLSAFTVGKVGNELSKQIERKNIIPEDFDG